MGIFGHNGLLSKGYKEVKKGVKEATEFVEESAKNVYDTAKTAVVETTHGIGNLAESGYYLATGDVKKAQQEFAKASGNIAAGLASAELTLNPVMMGINIATKDKLKGGVNLLKQGAEMIANYTTGNFNAGSQNLENITGWDVDNSIAEAKEAAARAKYQAEVDKANEAEARNRRANLLSLRKSLTPTLSRASQGGGGAGYYYDEKAQGGITLG